MVEPEQQKISPMYDPRFEHDACGIGAVISIQGVKTNDTVDRALKIVEKLEHRAGKDASGEVGDGVGLMIQVPHRLMLRAAKTIGIKNPILTSVELLKIKYMDNPGFRAETLDLSGLLSNPYGDRVPHFNPSQVYDFHLEDTKSAEITDKLAKSLKGKRQADSMWQCRPQTAPSAPCLAQKSPASAGMSCLRKAM